MPSFKNLTDESLEKIGELLLDRFQATLDQHEKQLCIDAAKELRLSDVLFEMDTEEPYDLLSEIGTITKRYLKDNGINQ